MPMQFLVTKQAIIMEDQLRARLAEIDRTVDRLRKEREIVESRLKRLEGPRAPKASAKPLVLCPKCGRDRDFMIDRGGYLGHVLEDPDDIEDLEPNKPIFCPACGEVFLFQKTATVSKKKR
jgi:hypothetical protein